MRSPRSEFGQRLFDARKHAKMTQAAGAKGIIGQGTLAELEWTGQGSSHTTALAARYGVRAEWLADGMLPMVAVADSSAGSTPASNKGNEHLAASLQNVANAASAVGKDARESASKLVALVVTDPDRYAEDLIPIIVRQLSGESGSDSEKDKPEPRAA